MCAAGVFAIQRDGNVAAVSSGIALFVCGLLVIMGELYFTDDVVQYFRFYARWLGKGSLLILLGAFAAQNELFEGVAAIAMAAVGVFSIAFHFLGVQSPLPLVGSGNLYFYRRGEPRTFVPPTLKRSRNVGALPSGGSSAGGQRQGAAEIHVERVPKSDAKRIKKQRKENLGSSSSAAKAKKAGKSCSSCGETLQASDRFCPGCGERN